MISAIAWVKRGSAARVPRTEGDLDEEGDELEPVPPVEGQAGSSKSGAAGNEKTAGAKASSSSGGGGSKGTRTAADVEEEEDDEGAHPIAAGDLMYYGNNKDDPNITLRDDEDLDSEADDFVLGPTDLLLLGARSDEHLSNLEAYVYEEPHDNLYPHHDIPLPVYPLCLEWLDFTPQQGSSGARGNRGGGHLRAVH